MLSLNEIQSFSDTVSVMIMVATFLLCPTLLLGHTLFINSTILLYIVAIVGNGVLYGIASAIIGLGFALLQRLIAHIRNG